MTHIQRSEEAGGLTWKLEFGIWKEIKEGCEEGRRGCADEGARPAEQGVVSLRRNRCNCPKIIHGYMYVTG